MRGICLGQGEGGTEFRVSGVFSYEIGENPTRDLNAVLRMHTQEIICI